MAEQLLLQHCAQVDLVEPSRHLLEAAREKLGGSCPDRAGDGARERCAFPRGHRAVHFHNCGLQAWTPEAGRRAHIELVSHSPKCCVFHEVQFLCIPEFLVC